MTSALAYMDYTSFPGRTGTAGVSDESKLVRKMYRNAISHFFEPISEAQRVVETLHALNEVYEGCHEEGWDGYDAKPVTEDTIVEAARLVLLLPLSVPAPTVSPEPTGEIALEWYKDRQHVFAASVGGKSIITYAGLFGPDNRSYGAEHLGDSLPSPIVENINRLNL